MGSRSRAFGMAPLGAQQRTKACKRDILLETEKALASALTEIRAALAASPRSPAELSLQDSGERVRKKN